MSGDNFEAAVAMAHLSGNAFRRQGLPMHAASAEEYLLHHELGLRYVESAAGLWTVIAPDAMERLYDLAFSDNAARSLLRQHLIRKLLHLVPLSPLESKAAAHFLEGTFSKLPERRGPKQASHFERDFHIFALARCLVERFGLTLTRNDATQEARSACDAISFGFVKAGLNEVTYIAVNNVVFRRDLKERVERYQRLLDTGKIQ